LEWIAAKTELLMKKHVKAVDHDLGGLADDARALIAATADVAGEKVGEARKRLMAALERGAEIAGRIGSRAVEGSKAADEAMREHRFKTLGLVLLAGVVIGHLIAHACGRERD
jgi:ElaB/YqjD/DUF883 family membrane-anchored ribosome-binding protein